MTRGGDEERGCVIEVHSVSWEERNVLLARLHRAFVATDCWAVAYRRCGGRALEYSFELELRHALDLYCGLVQAGLEMTSLSHRALTEVCVLRSHQRALDGQRCVMCVRLIVTFPESAEDRGSSVCLGRSV
ncbi:MAG TPA: hypothetical protein VGM11_06860 [Acidobacteriaceae bacterium]|jgi:hypothetical protein